MPSPLQNIETRLAALETKIDQILEQPALPLEVNLDGVTAMLGQILGKIDQILSIVQPQQQPDLILQGQQLYAQLQQQIQQALTTLQNFQSQLQPIIPEE